MDITAHCQALRQRISDACNTCGRHSDQLRIIAVTKTQDPPVLSALAENGFLDYGENRIDHALTMHVRAQEIDAAVIHCIGRVQSRQLSQWVTISDTIHSLHSLSHVKHIAKACVEHDKSITVFCQVNTSGEESKAGLPPDQLNEMIDACAVYAERVHLVGLMCMAPARTDSNESEIRSCFADLYTCAQNHGLNRLSMGMSGDFDLAIQEGATDLRIGSSFFT